MKNGFVKIATATPEIRVADCVYNAEACSALTHEAAGQGAALIVFPELCLTGYTCGDLFTHSRLLTGALDALREYLAATVDCETVSVVGLPIVHADKLYNCAAVCQSGILLGLVPKAYVTAAEARWFTPAPDANLTYEFDGAYVQMGKKQLFVSTVLPTLRFGVEIGEDMSVPVPPSTFLAMAGATIICVPSSTPESVGMSEYRRRTVIGLSERLATGYLLTESGKGESTTDTVYAGHSIIAENGKVLSERMPFATEELTVTELDLELLTHERRHRTTYPNTGAGEYTEAYFTHSLIETPLTRPIKPHPFIPVSETERTLHCEHILSIQAEGLAQRLVRAGAKKAVVGISGGLDSCLALLVMGRTMDLLGRPRTDILAVTMPGFGTTGRTRNNATVLCEDLGVEFRTVCIGDAVQQHFKDIGHDFEDRNVVYENAQARERTQVLMDIANEEGGLVVGTGDLSELALGWATYNGDHMSMYGVNGAIPKTLVRHLVVHCANEARAAGQGKLAEALSDILSTPVSPELLPADAEGKIAQKTEDLVGPYELHDFYLYYLIRYGFAPDKLFRLARYALGDIYDDATLLKWLETLVRRFFNQQFKRSCLPDGPAVGSVSLSPRGGWIMPSDAVAALWMADIAELKDTFL